MGIERKNRGVVGGMVREVWLEDGDKSEGWVVGGNVVVRGWL